MTAPEDDRPVGEVPPDVDLLDRRRADGYVPTTEQVRNNMAFGAACAFVALRKPDDDLAAAMRDIDWPMPGLRVQIKAEFDQWLATHPTPDAYQALLTQLHEARAALEALGRERNTWARQMADLRDERDTAREAEAAARLDHGRLATERDVAQVEADEARAEVARLRVGMGGAKENHDRARRALVARAASAETREAALRAGIEGLADSIPIECCKGGHAEEFSNHAYRYVSTLCSTCDDIIRRLRALLDGEVRP